MSSRSLRILPVPQDIIQKIEAIIGLPRLNEKNFNNWEVLDGSLPKKNLYILHHTEQSDEEIAGFTRGLVVDVENGIVVRRTFGREPETDLSSIPEEGPFEIQGKRGTILKIGDSSLIVPGLDGLIVSVSYYGREVLYGTHKFVDITNTRSRRTMSKQTYFQQLDGYGGINTLELFDTTKSYSPHVHYFLLAHEDIMVASKMPYEFMGIYYLGSRRMWGEPTVEELENTSYLQLKADKPVASVKSPFVPGIVDNQLRTPEHLLTPGQPRAPGQYFSLPSLNRAKANEFLQTGYYTIENSESIAASQLPGEFIMIYQYDERGQVNKAVRVNSLSYQHRYEILHPSTGLEWNMEARFLRLINDAVGPHRIVTLHDNGSGARENIEHRPKMQFVHYPPIDYEELTELVRQRNAVYYADEVKSEVETSYELSVYNLWLNMLYAAPVTRQNVAFELLTEYYEAVRILTWYISFYQNDLSELTKDGYGLLVSFARMANKDGVDTKDIEAVHSWVNENIFSIPGSVLYTNVSAARKAYNEMVLDRAIWLVRALGGKSESGLFDIVAACEWVRDCFRNETRSVKEVEDIVETFKQRIAFLSGVLDQYKFSITGGYDEARDALRVAVMAEKLTDFLWFSEALDVVYEKGLSRLIEAYRAISPEKFFERLSEADPTLYDLFVHVHRRIEEGLTQKRFDVAAIFDENAPQQVSDSILSLFYELPVNDTTMIQHTLTTIKV